MTNRVSLNDSIGMLVDYSCQIPYLANRMSSWAHASKCTFPLHTECFSCTFFRPWSYGKFVSLLNAVVHLQNGKMRDQHSGEGETIGEEKYWVCENVRSVNKIWK